MESYFGVLIGILIGMGVTGSFVMTYIVSLNKHHNRLLRGMLNALDETVDRVHKFDHIKENLDQIMKDRKKPRWA